MTTRTSAEQEDRLQRLNDYLKLELTDGPYLLPRFWWLAFAFGIPFLLVGSSVFLLALWQHVAASSTEVTVMRAAIIAGILGLGATTYFYWALVLRVREHTRQ